MDYDSISSHFGTQPPTRVVSLVPSLTESLFDLGLGGAVVGATNYCTQPEEKLKNIPRVGGPLDARLELIMELNPDLVICAIEENPRLLVGALQNAGIPVWAVDPRSVRQVVDMLWQMAHLFKNEMAMMHMIPLETSLEWTQASGEDGATWSYFCPIWMEGDLEGDQRWMTFNRDTYPADLLRYFGGINVFADLEKELPPREKVANGLEMMDTRYPWVGLPEIRAAQPEVIVLPDEPFTFLAEHEAGLRNSLCDIPAVINNRVLRIDGSLITWYGTRLARALIDLPELLGR